MRTRTFLLRPNAPRRAAVFLALALAACTEEPDGGAGGPAVVATPVAFDDYCDEYARMSCDIGKSCQCFADGSYDLCRTYIGLGCRDEVEAPVREGRRRYDELAAGQCLGELSAIASDCSLSDAYWPDACDAMLVGIVPAGGACSSDGDCVAGLECRGDVCRALPGDGAPCDPEYGCAEGAFCGDDGRCAAYRGDGGPCPEGGVACDEGLYCDATTIACEPYLGAGASCASSPGACDSDLYCAPATQTCEPYPGDGESCSESGCRDGAYCGTDSICHDEKPEGAACAEDQECASDSCTGGRCEQDQADVCDSVG